MMRSARVAAHAPADRAPAALTTAESTFRNPKLGDASLVAYKAVADILAKSSLFALTVLAARRLSPWGFGVFALGTTVGWLLAVVTDCGLQLHLARAVARRPDDASALLRRWGRLRIISTVCGLGGLGVAVRVASPGVAWSVPLMLFASAYAATGFVEFLNYFYRGLSRSDIESTLTIGQRLATLTAGGFTLLFWPDVNALALAMLLPALATLAWSSAFAIRFEVRLPTSAADASRADTFRRDVLPIGLGVVLSALYFRIDVLLIEWWSGTEAVAAYNAVFRIIDALRLFPAAVLAVALPGLCRATDLRLLAGIAGGLAAFAVSTAAVLWVGADRLIPFLFGAAFRHAVPAFRILTLSFPLLTLNFALTHQLVGWNRHRAYAAIAAAALVANLGLNAWLIPILSIAGAAWATLGTELFLTAGCLIALRARTA